MRSLKKITKNIFNKKRRKVKRHHQKRNTRNLKDKEIIGNEEIRKRRNLNNMKL